MKHYKVLLSKKEYALFIIEANSKKEAISKAHNDDYIEVIHDPEKLPNSNYIIEKVIEDTSNRKKSRKKLIDNTNRTMSKTKYKVTVTESLEKEIEIYAENEEEAINIVEDKYNDEDIVLDYCDFASVSFDVNEPEEL